MLTPACSYMKRPTGSPLPGEKSGVTQEELRHRRDVTALDHRVQILHFMELQTCPGSHETQGKFEDFLGEESSLFLGEERCRNGKLETCI